MPKYRPEDKRDAAKGILIRDIPIDAIDPFPNHPYQVKLPVPKANFHTEVLKPSEIQKDMVEGLSERVERIRSGSVDPSVDNMLKITNDGRKLALDMRLINPLSADDENGKVATCAENVQRIWEKSKDFLGAQLVFCDLSTPKNDGSIALRPAVELSYLSKEKQEILTELIDMEQCTPNHAQAIRMRRMEAEGKLSEEVIEATMQEQKPNQKERIVLRGERFACLHNHPSGSLKPSEEDKQVTAKLLECGRVLDIPLLDHIIVAGETGEMYSFRQEGLLEQLGRKEMVAER